MFIAPELPDISDKKAEPEIRDQMRNKAQRTALSYLGGQAFHKGILK
jgi:hypothetical protein